MKIRTMAWFAGSAFVAATGALGAAACSSSGTGTPGALPTGNDAGGDGTTSPIADAGTADNVTTPGADSAINGDGGGSPDCGKAAVIPPAPEAGTGAYCAHQVASAPKRCAMGQECCAPKFPADPAPQTCITQGTACTFAVDGGKTWECDDDSQCPAGQSQCCATGTLKNDPGCTNFFGSHTTGSYCRAACGAGESRACTSQGQCEAGTCTPYAAGGRDFAVCH